MAATRLAVRRVIRAGGHRQLLVACSGGADSLALAAATAFEAPRAGLSAAAVVVDHGLQADSASVAARAAKTCRDLGLDPVEIVAVRVQETGTGPEDAARGVRYRALTQAADELHAEVILLGHTRDDQAETVLLGLARGSGLRSLAGMPAADPGRRISRPFLELTREQTRAACVALGLSWWEDPHNTDDRYARVRARQALVGLERDLGPGVIVGLTRTADLARSDADGLDALAARALAGLGEPPWPVPALLDLIAPVRRRVWRLLLGETAKVHVDRLEELLADWHGQVGVDVPGGRRVSRRGGLIEVDRAPGRNPTGKSGVE